MMDEPIYVSSSPEPEPEQKLNLDIEPRPGLGPGAIIGIDTDTESDASTSAIRHMRRTRIKARARQAAGVARDRRTQSSYSRGRQSSIIDVDPDSDSDGTKNKSLQSRSTSRRRATGPSWQATRATLATLSHTQHTQAHSRVRAQAPRRPFMDFETDWGSDSEFDYEKNDMPPLAQGMPVSRPYFRTNVHHLRSRPRPAGVTPPLRNQARVPFRATPRGRSRSRNRRALATRPLPLPPPPRLGSAGMSFPRHLETGGWDDQPNAGWWGGNSDDDDSDDEDMGLHSDFGMDMDIDHIEPLQPARGNRTGAAPPAAPTVAPELLSEATARVLEVFPDVDPEHLAGLIRRDAPEFGYGVVDRVVNALWEDVRYPKVDRRRKANVKVEKAEGKGKGKATEDAGEGASMGKGKGKGKRRLDDGGDGSEVKKMKVDYADRTRPFAGGPHYEELALEQLQEDFPLIPRVYLKKMLGRFGRLYAPTWIFLDEQEEKRKEKDKKKDVGLSKPQPETGGAAESSSGARASSATNTLQQTPTLSSPSSGSSIMLDMYIDKLSGDLGSSGGTGSSSGASATSGFGVSSTYGTNHAYGTGTGTAFAHTGNINIKPNHNDGPWSVSSTAPITAPPALGPPLSSRYSQSNHTMSQQRDAAATHLLGVSASQLQSHSPLSSPQSGAQAKPQPQPQPQFLSRAQSGVERAQRSVVEVSNTGVAKTALERVREGNQARGQLPGQQGPDSGSGEALTSLRRGTADAQEWSRATVRPQARDGDSRIQEPFRMDEEDATLRRARVQERRAGWGSAAAALERLRGTHTAGSSSSLAGALGDGWAGLPRYPGWSGERRDGLGPRAGGASAITAADWMTLITRPHQVPAVAPPSYDELDARDRMMLTPQSSSQVQSQSQTQATSFGATSRQTNTAGVRGAEAHSSPVLLTPDRYRQSPPIHHSQVNPSKRLQSQAQGTLHGAGSTVGARGAPLSLSPPSASAWDHPFHTLVSFDPSEQSPFVQGLTRPMDTGPLSRANLNVPPARVEPRRPGPPQVFSRSMGARYLRESAQDMDRSVFSEWGRTLGMNGPHPNLFEERTMHPRYGTPGSGAASGLSGATRGRLPEIRQAVFHPHLLPRTEPNRGQLPVINTTLGSPPLLTSAPDSDEELDYVPLTTPYRPSPKGKMRMKHDDEFARELAWVQDYKARKRQERLEAEAEADDGEREDGTECQCCFSNFLIEKMVQCGGGHYFCRRCIATRVSALLGTQTVEFQCLDISGCALHIPDAEVVRALPAKTVKLWERVKQRKELEAAGLVGWEECPFCEFGCVMEVPVEQDKLFRCLNEEVCGVVSCRMCRNIDHLPKSCEEYEMDKVLDGRHHVEEAMSQALMRRCPKCKKAFVKQSGCNHITCPHCRASSCYLCRQLIVPGDGHFTPMRDGSYRCMGDGSVEELHAREVEEARQKAIAAYKLDHPDVDDAQLQVEFPRVEPARLGMASRAFGLGAWPDPDLALQMLRELHRE